MEGGGNREKGWETLISIITVSNLTHPSWLVFVSAFLSNYSWCWVPADRTKLIEKAWVRPTCWSWIASSERQEATGALPGAIDAGGNHFLKFIYCKELMPKFQMWSFTFQPISTRALTAQQWAGHQSQTSGLSSCREETRPTLSRWAAIALRQGVHQEQSAHHNRKSPWAYYRGQSWTWLSD